MALINKLENIGNAIRSKTGGTELLKLDEMPAAIESIETGGGGAELPEEAFIIIDDCEYRFAGEHWKHFFEYEGWRNKWRTERISKPKHMFYKNTSTIIPFSLNLRTDIGGGLDARSMFDYCANLKALPDVSPFTPKDVQYIFENCRSIREIPQSWLDNVDFSTINNSSSVYLGTTLYNLNSIRSFPTEFLKKWHGAETQSLSSSSALYNSLFYNAYVIDEIIGIPVYGVATSNRLNTLCYRCGRAKNIIFETNEDGTPKTANWKSQTIDFSSYIGYSSVINDIINYNSGITADKEVKDAATYAALKDNNDWFTFDYNYSRYNHDSAVNTINSLPDTTSAGGTNTIKFKGAAGSATDGGAINTLTAEEIAVAAAKGWTVTLT